MAVGLLTVAAAAIALAPAGITTIAGTAETLAIAETEPAPRPQIRAITTTTWNPRTITTAEATTTTRAAEERTGEEVEFPAAAADTTRAARDETGTAGKTIGTTATEETTRAAPTVAATATTAAAGVWRAETTKEEEHGPREVAEEEEATGENAVGFSSQRPMAKGSFLS